MPAATLVKPRALRPGAVIGVCAPAGPVVSPGALAAGLAWLEREGFQLRCAPHLRERRGYLAAGDAERLADLQALVRDPEVACIVAARGGYGMPRIVGSLDPGELVRSRKLFVGYSDLTALSLLLERAGLVTVHGPMLERDDLSDEARARLLCMLRGEPGGRAPLSGKTLAAGRAVGRLVGGNLKLLNASLGTPWELRSEGAILFFEERGEQPYAIDRALVQLRDAGVLRGVAGVAVGQLVDCESERYPEVSACDVVRELLAPEISGPVVSGLPFGHVADNRALGVGLRAELDGDAGTLTLLEDAVEDAS